MAPSPANSPKKDDIKDPEKRYILLNKFNIFKIYYNKYK